MKEGKKEMLFWIESVKLILGLFVDKNWQLAKKKNHRRSFSWKQVGGGGEDGGGRNTRVVTSVDRRRAKSDQSSVVMTVFSCGIFVGLSLPSNVVDRFVEDSSEGPSHEEEIVLS